MKKQAGSRQYPIWLIGDSNPVKWETVLDEPLDSRHPARHNIWTPILERIQSRLYENTRKRLQIDDLYVRNAIEASSRKPDSNKKDWHESVEEEARRLAGLIDTHKPKLVFTFGSFAFEFSRRGRGESPLYAYSYWSANRLGEEFKCRMNAACQHNINVLPLLHVSIARGHFLKHHQRFTRDENGNYFDFVGTQIADFMSQNHTEFPIE